MFSFPCICAAVNDKRLDMQFRVEETCWSLNTYLAHRHQELHCGLHQRSEKHPHAQISWVHLFLPQSRSQGDEKRNGGM